MIYLDNSATTRFKPVSVLNTLYFAALNSANPGRGGHSDSIKAAETVFAARKTLLKAFGAEGGDYEAIFTSNCTEALNIVISGLAPKHSIVDAYSHNSVLRPVKALSDTGAEFTLLDVIDKETLRASVRENTELIVVNHVSNVNGRLADIKAAASVAREQGIPLLVDGAQSLGHIAVDMKADGIDFLAGAGHKGLHGIQGTGFLIMRRDIKLKPLKTGGTGTESYSIDQPKNLPEALESGTLNYPGIAALKAGIEWTYANQRAVKAHSDALSALGHKLLASVSEVILYSDFPSPIIAFNVRGHDSEEIADFLNERGIAVRSGLHCAPLAHKALGTLEGGIVRASVGMNNTKSDIVELYKAVHEFCRR